MLIEGKQIHLYSERENRIPLVIVNTFQGDGSDIYSALRKMTNEKFSPAVIGDVNWDDEMSPWEWPPPYKNGVPCTGGADKYFMSLCFSYPTIVTFFSLSKVWGSFEASL